MKLLENDYKQHQLDYRKADLVIKKNMRIVLPDLIYQNVLEIFEELLEMLKEDLLRVSSSQKVICIETLLRVMVYAKLFV